MPDHLELAHKMIKQSIEARERAAPDPAKTAPSFKQKTPDDDTRGLPGTGVEQSSDPGTRSVNDVAHSELDTAARHAEIKRNIQITYYMMFIKELLRMEDYEDPFWRRHFEPNVRLHIDDKTAIGLEEFWGLSNCSLFKYPSLRFSTLEPRFSELDPDGMCDVMIPYRYAGGADDLTRAGIVSAKWKFVNKVVWKCSEFTSFTGLNTELTNHWDEEIVIKAKSLQGQMW